MKRNRNFLLIVWAASLLGLSAVRTAHARLFIPSELGVYESPKETPTGNVEADSVHALLSSSAFDPEQKAYDLISAYKSRSLSLAFKWAEVAGTDLVQNGDTAKVEVFVNGDKITTFKVTGGDFLSFADSVYLIPFGSGLDSVVGRVEVTIPAIYNGGVEKKEIYSATVRRGVVDDITALRNIWITDSIGKKINNTVVAFQDTIFKQVAGADGKLRPGSEPWEVSFKDLDTKDETSTRGRADTLYFTKFDAQSTVKVIINNRDTMKLSQTDVIRVISRDSALANDSPERDSIFHIGSEIYKVKIHAGNSYKIEVTARDKKTKDYYHITLLADTIKPNPDPNSAILETLKDLYLYEGDKKNPSKRYDLKPEGGGVGFDTAKTKYRVTVNAPWSAIAGESPSISVGYDFWDGSLIKDEHVEVFQSVSEGKKFIKVFTRLEEGDSTYTIEVFNGNTQLKSFRLSSDADGLKPIELTRDSAGDYTSAAVDYTVSSVFAWAALEESTAKVVNVDQDTKWTENTNDEYRRLLSLSDLVKNGGGNQTFLVSVLAGDTTVTKTYKVTVKMNYDPTPDKVAFTWSGDVKAEFTRDKLRSDSVFDVSIPADVEIESIEHQVEKSNEELFRVFKGWIERDGVYTYIVKVTSRVDGATKTYTFNLLYPSSDASLSFLAVPGFELSPAFDPAILAYTVIVPSEQASINFIAQAHTKATVTGDRTHTLHGDSTFAIEVTAEDKVTTKTYRIRVTDNSHTGIQLAGGSSVQIYVSNQSLHVSTPAAERVSVYSAGGQLLYSLDKQAGKTFVSTFPKGVLIVKGSSGWVKKVALH
ncbi:MAG: cadherin-like beta sandwich domain-containing protein [Dysgonamonadaceae bacterium]|jgi:hypothetical protein|nr:cadherin-like beta sandwich domain-containing protein [Dysgonamonadaceae bacterium]